MRHIFSHSRAKYVPVVGGIIALIAAGVAPVAAGTINSNLQIEAGKTFELGGGQEGAFIVTGRNTGPVAVEVLGKPEGEAAAVRGTVAPGGAVNARFAAGETALLRNTSAARMATLKLTISGDTSDLGMSYTGNR